MIRVDPETVALLLNAEELPQMIRDLAEASGFTVEELTGPGRTYKLAHMRQYGMLLAYRAGYSAPQIGAVFNRDHTTVLHGIDAATRRIKNLRPHIKRRRPRKVEA